MSLKREREDEYGVVKVEIEQHQPPLKKRKIDCNAPMVESFRMFDNFSSPATASKQKQVPEILSDSQAEVLLKEIGEEEIVEGTTLKNQVVEEEMIEDSYDFESEIQEEENSLNKSCQTMYSRKLDERDLKIVNLELEVEQLKVEKKEWNEALKEIENNSDQILDWARSSGKSGSITSSVLVPPPPPEAAIVMKNELLSNRKKKKLFQTCIDAYIK